MGMRKNSEAREVACRPVVWLKRDYKNTPGSLRALNLFGRQTVLLYQRWPGMGEQQGFQTNAQCNPWLFQQ
jgi:hypothetical protein